MGIIAWLAETLFGDAFWAWIKSRFHKPNPLEQVEEADAIADKNRSTLHDGDAAKLLRDEWSKPE